MKLSEINSNIEIAKLANMLNCVAGEMVQIEKNLTSAQTRIVASQNSIWEIQAAIIKEINKQRQAK